MLFAFCRIRWTAVLTALCVFCAALAGTAVGAEESAADRQPAEKYRIADGNKEYFNRLLTALVKACEESSTENTQEIESCLQAIKAVRASDYEIAFAIAEHWKKVFLDENYPLYLYSGGERAEALEGTAIADSGKHAFVVLGYALADGEMTPELKGRCRAAAAAAKSFPDSILVCSGGATGGNNPEKNTEAGLMKQYLVRQCGIDASRIFIDEKAMTTAENAVNTFEILRNQGIEAITVVTSDYHQKWGQAIYNAVGALSRQENGYCPEILENYCYEISPSSERYRSGAQIASRQIAGVLGLEGGSGSGSRR